jgi:nicotinamide-nucleotide amidase
MMFDAALLDQARKVLDGARAKNIRIVTAESCTGGLIAGLLTEIPGSSDVVERGFVTYSNEAKEESLGVPTALLRKYGAVSDHVARAMADGALRHSRAQLAIAVTGIAGPGGGSVERPVGLVYIAVARLPHARVSALEGEVPFAGSRASEGRRGENISSHEFRFGDVGRGEVRLATMREALKLLASALN